MVETITEQIMEGLAPVLAVSLILGIILVAVGAAIGYILAVRAAFEYHWALGCAVAILLFLAYVLIASFLVGLFLI